MPPQRTFSPADVRSYGADNVGDLLQAIAAQTTSIRGRDDAGPVVLLNGRRISGPDELSKIPTEAIERVDVYTEEVALSYGFRADQKVVNIVLFRTFRSRIAQGGASLPTEGGRDTADLSANLFRIRGDARLLVDAAFEGADQVLGGQRGLKASTEDPNLAGRTLLPRTRRTSLSATLADRLTRRLNGTLNLGFEANDGESLVGADAGGPTRRSTESRSIHAGTTIGGFIGDWPWTFTANYDRARTGIDTAATALLPEIKVSSLNQSADAGLLANGTVFRLPGGPVATSFRLGLETRSFGSASTDPAAQYADIARRTGTVQASLDLPLVRRRDDAGPLGGVAANLNARVDAVTGFGALRTLGYGLSWSPSRIISIIASATEEQGAPTVEQLASPRVTTPGYPVYDFGSGGAVSVTRIYGGNPALRHDDRHLRKLGITARPLSATDLVLSANFVSASTDDPIVNLPVLSAGIEAAFPQRFVRTPDGRLSSVDASPVNLRRSRQEQLRWGVDLTRPLGNVPPEERGREVRYAASEGDIKTALPPGAKVETPPAGSAAAKRIENLSSRLTLSLYHTWFLRDDAQPSLGGPTLDFLDGVAVDARGGRPRHEVQLQVGAYKHGLGVRITGDWRSGTRVDAASAVAGGTGNLAFSSYETLDLNLFANLGLLARPGGDRWLKGLRITASISNLFDARQIVRDDAGATPYSYQPGFIDPLGRVLKITARKIL